MAVQGGPLVEAYLSSSISKVSTIIKGAFFYPPVSFGFAVDEIGDMQYDLIPSIQEIGYFIAGAVSPESGYLEPTTGQIWPR